MIIFNNIQRSCDIIQHSTRHPVFSVPVFLRIKYTSFNVWVRYFVCNFEGNLWNSTPNILPIHWNIRFYTMLNLQELLDLRAHMCFWNAPQMYSHNALCVCWVRCCGRLLGFTPGFTLGEPSEAYFAAPSGNIWDSLACASERFWATDSLSTWTTAFY